MGRVCMWLPHPKAWRPPALRSSGAKELEATNKVMFMKPALAFRVFLFLGGLIRLGLLQDDVHLF